ncbi:MAG: 2'-5' RNA ligase family protein [Elainellaceae cyanobacterium]
MSAEDFDWIQRVRKQHDQLYWEVVDPHFTLVFPVSSLEEKAFIHHVEQAAKDIEAFDVVLRCAVLRTRKEITFTSFRSNGSTIDS